MKMGPGLLSVLGQSLIVPKALATQTLGIHTREEVVAHHTCPSGPMAPARRGQGGELTAHRGSSLSSEQRDDSSWSQTCHICFACA